MSQPLARSSSGTEQHSDSASADCRCMCGSLLARWVEGGVELKCRRCKRTIRVPLSPETPGGALRPVHAIPVGEAG